MNITTKFSLADRVYFKADAALGVIIPLIIEKIMITVETIDITVVTYQIYNTLKFHQDQAAEDELYTLEEANAIALVYLNAKRDSITLEIENLQ